MNYLHRGRAKRKLCIIPNLSRKLPDLYLSLSGPFDKLRVTLTGILVTFSMLICAQEKELVVSLIYEKDTISIILTNTTNDFMQIYNRGKLNDASRLSFSYTRYQYDYSTRSMIGEKINEYETIFSYPVNYQQSYVQNIDSIEHEKIIEIEPFKSLIFKFLLDSVGQKTDKIDEFYLLTVSCSVCYYIPKKKVYHNFVYRKFTFSLNDNIDQIMVAFSAPLDAEKIRELINTIYINEDSVILNKNKHITEKELPEALEPDSLDIRPKFRGGGDRELMQYLRKNLRFQEQYGHGTPGRVIIEFIIEEDGSITNLVLIRTVDPGLDREAIRVVSTMPNWEPGYKNGVPVRVKFRMPVIFRVQ